MLCRCEYLIFQVRRENTASARSTQATTQAVSGYHRTMTSGVTVQAIFSSDRDAILAFRATGPVCSIHYRKNAMAEPTTLSHLTLAELKNLVEGLVDDRLRVLLGDPDLGAPLGASVRDRLKQSLASTERLTGDEVADKLGLRW